MNSAHWAISPLDGRYAGELENIAPLVSEAGLFRYRIVVEIRWLLYLNQMAKNQLRGLRWQLTAQEETFLRSFLQREDPQEIVAAIKAIEARTKHDVKATEYYLAERLRAIGAQAQTIALVHFGCTSEDINNLSYGLMLTEVHRTHILPAMRAVIEQLGQLAQTYAGQAMLARTHGQSASPTTLGKELAVFGHRLLRIYNQLEGYKFRGKWGGAVGNYNAHYCALPEVAWLTVAQSFVEEELGLKWNQWTTQIEDHDTVAQYCDGLRLYNTVALGLAQDCWQYISQGYLRQLHHPGEVGSSTMPHKINPIAFENAEGQFGLSSSLAQFFSQKLPISRLQRDLSDSTVQRSIGSMLAHHLLAQQALLRGLQGIAADSEAMNRDLDQAWEVLGEALQTILRCHGRSDAYELVKEASRGKRVEQSTLLELAQAHLPAEVVAKFADLSPRNYVGLAPQLAAAFAQRVANYFAGQSSAAVVQLAPEPR